MGLGAAAGAARRAALQRLAELGWLAEPWSHHAGAVSAARRAAAAALDAAAAASSAAEERAEAAERLAGEVSDDAQHVRVHNAALRRAVAAADGAAGDAGVALSAAQRRAELRALEQERRCRLLSSDAAALLQRLQGVEARAAAAEAAVAAAEAAAGAARAESGLLRSQVRVLSLALATATVDGAASDAAREAMPQEMRRGGREEEGAMEEGDGEVPRSAPLPAPVRITFDDRPPGMAASAGHSFA